MTAFDSNPPINDNINSRPGVDQMQPPLVDMADKSQTQVLMTPSDSQSQPSLSSDGKFMLFGSAFGSGPEHGWPGQMGDGNGQGGGNFDGQGNGQGGQRQNRQLGDQTSNSSSQGQGSSESGWNNGNGNGWSHDYGWGHDQGRDQGNGQSGSGQGNSGADSGLLETMATIANTEGTIASTLLQDVTALTAPTTATDNPTTPASTATTDNPTTAASTTTTDNSNTSTSATTTDTSATPTSTSTTAATPSSSGDGTTTVLQQMEVTLTDISQELSTLITELGELPGSSGSASNTASGDSSAPPVTTPGAPESTVPAGNSTGSGAPESTAPAGNSTEPGGGNSTGNSGSDSPPPSTTSSDGPGAATISTPNGTEQVGSTATVFGAAAMPSAATVANAYYVSSDASGDGAGSLGSASNPFSTLQQAQQAMENSNTKTTYVEGGTYDLSSTLNLSSADSGESFIAAPGSSQPAVIDGGGNVSNLMSINGANDITVEGLTMQDTQAGSIFSNPNSGDAIVATNSSGDNFSYNDVNNVGMAYNMSGVSNSQFNSNDITNVQQAIYMTSGNNYSDNNTIDGNDITNVSDVTSSPAGAITLFLASNNTIGNNVIENVTGAGIRVGGNVGQNTTGNVITQNTVEDVNTAAYATANYSGQGDNGAIYAWQGPGNTNNMHLTISNNYISNAGQGFENTGIYLDDGVDGANVTGNVVDDNGMGWSADIHGGSNNTIQNNVFDLTSASGQEKGVLYQNDGPQMTNNNISNNIFYATTANGGAITPMDNANDTPTVANNIYQGVTVPSLDTNPISADPEFIDPADGNYTVQAGSPATAIGF